jgi:hypothetical protein
MQVLWFIVRLNEVSKVMVVCVRICDGIKCYVKCGGGGEVSCFVGKVLDRSES